MYDEMWEENTEEIFQSITIERALSDPPWKSGILTKLWAQTKAWEDSILVRSMNNLKRQSPDKMGRIKFRRYSTMAPSTKPLITGRVATGWLLDNMWEVSHEDFYNQALTEQDLKNKLGGKHANKKTVVRNANTKTELTLGVSGSFRSAVSSGVPGLGDGNFFYLEERQETENQSKSDG